MRVGKRRGHYWEGEASCTHADGRVYGRDRFFQPLESNANYRTLSESQNHARACIQACAALRSIYTYIIRSPSRGLGVQQHSPRPPANGELPGEGKLEIFVKKGCFLGRACEFAKNIMKQPYFLAETSAARPRGRHTRAGPRTAPEGLGAKPYSWIL